VARAAGESRGWLLLRARWSGANDRRSGRGVAAPLREYRQSAATLALHGKQERIRADAGLPRQRKRKCATPPLRVPSTRPGSHDRVNRVDQLREEVDVRSTLCVGNAVAARSSWFL
jgi:hypothetical protein